jgi:hypothetical protein
MQVYVMPDARRGLEGPAVVDDRIRSTTEDIPRSASSQLPQTPYVLYYLPMAGREQDIIEADEISLKERFFRYFQHEITGI